MFDLPVKTARQRRSYTLFRKFLISNGFMMMQESIYCKLVQNETAADLVMTNIRRNKPTEGLVQALKITEKQYSRIEFIVGEKRKDVVDTDNRLVIL